MSHFNHKNARIRKMAAKGMTVLQIARKLGDTSLEGQQRVIDGMNANNDEDRAKRG